MSIVSNQNKFLLSEAQHEAIFQEEIRPYLFKNANSVECPTVIIFGGQPGAGKSIVVDLAQEELEKQGGVVSIVGDDLRLFHPNHEYLMRLDDKTAAFYTGQDSGKWVEKAVHHAKQLRYNVVIEGTMRSFKVVERTIKIFKEANYQIDARILAVNERLSWQGVLQRYENQRADRGAGRMTLLDAHQEAYKGLSISLDKIEKELLANKVTVYARGAVILYQNELLHGDWQYPPRARGVLESERNRPWTLPERLDYAKGFDKLLELIQKPQRRASAEEINTIKTLREQAYREIELHQSELQLFS